MKVSVIVPVYNGESDLPDLIECLRSQTISPEEVEYFIVDNNSSDRTSEILQAATPFVTPLNEPKIQSSYAARNVGIRAAKGEILAFTDADCRPQPDWLEKLIAPFSKPEIGLSVGEVVAFPGETLFEKHADRRNILSQKYTLNHPFLPYGQTANLAVRRSLFDRVGLFRPYLTTAGDADLCWRVLQETEAKLEFVPEAIVKHRHRATLDELLSQMRRYGKAEVYLHELHGIDLSPNPKTSDRAKIWARWFIKVLPTHLAKAIVNKADWVDLWETPLNALKARARIASRDRTKLPENARYIERLHDTESD